MSYSGTRPPLKRPASSTLLTTTVGYRFPAYGSECTAPGRRTPERALCVRVHYISDFVSSSITFGLRAIVYYFSDFVSASTAFRTSCPHLLHFELHVRTYYISDFVSTITAFRTSCPYRFLDFVSTFNVFPRSPAARDPRRPKEKKIMRAGQGNAHRLPVIPAGPEWRNRGYPRFSPKSAEILTEKRKRLQSNEQKNDSGGGEQNPARENEKFALVLSEAQIDHGEVSAMSRTITSVHSSPHRGIQGREPPPAASSPLFSAIPTARPAQIYSAQRARRPNAPVRPSISSKRFLLRAGSPIRSDPIRPAIFFFIIFTESPLNIPN
ncbi:hypothetical protein CRG98_003414 [Punica granatum]|uniref:Uncharacterized protein n=1 Tax=Punica granatum TaxID=22663 RepID=A0A2I0L651_PUNGR|nr:hypothetical protein CRG98_003414 [Punica granatum]